MSYSKRRRQCAGGTCARPRRAQLHRRGPLLCCAVLAAVAAAKPAEAAYTLNTLVNFNGTNGQTPVDSPLFDSSGNLFGVTFAGGANNEGTIYEIAAGTRAFSTIATFNGSNGANPNGALTFDTGGNLYGVTYSGGASNDGTAYEISAGAHTLSTLFSFNASSGYLAGGKLVADTSGNLYGAASDGGSASAGTVYEITASSHAYTQLLAVNSPNQNPNGVLAIDGNGNLYGTFQAGASPYGSVFEIANGMRTLTTIATMSGSGSGTTGSAPIHLVTDPAGNIYGEAQRGGASNDGTIFEVQAGTHAVITLATFTGTNGQNPYGTISIDAAGNLYGATSNGGTSGNGTIWKIAAGSRSFITLVNFNSTNGADPDTGLTEDASGNLFGSTDGGGTNSAGTIFELSPAANTTPVYSFTGGTNWNTAANWSSSNVANSSVNANFALNSSYSLTFNASSNANDLHIAAGSPTFVLTAGQSLNLSGGISVADASGENASLTINGGTLISSGASSNSFRFGYSYIGDNNNSTGSLTLNSNTWKNAASNFDVGASGTGTLILNNASTLNMSVGGGVLSLGDFAGGVGTLQVSGGSSVLTTNQFNVGNAGSGHLLISGGGLLTAATSNIAADAGALPSDATVTGNGSAWNTSGNLYVGGYSAIAGSQGTLNVNSGGSVNVTGTLKIWNGTNTGVNLSAGGTIKAGNIDTSGTPSNFNWTGGTLSITNSDLYIQAGGVLGAGVGINNGMTLRLTDSALRIETVGTGYSAVDVSTGGEVDSASIQLGTASGSSSSVLQLDGGVVNTGNVTDCVAGGGAIIINSGTLNAGTTLVGTASNAYGGISVLNSSAYLNDSASMYLGGSATAAGGTGRLNINNGGNVDVAGTLKVWNTPSSVINLGPTGTLTVGSLDTSGNPSLFNWTGGTLNINTSLTIDNQTTSPLGQNFTLANGYTLTSNYYEYVGVSSAGTFTQNPGSSNSTNELIVGNANSSSYTLNGGNFTTGEMYISYGAYNQFGGTMTNASLINLFSPSDQANGKSSSFNLFSGNASTNTLQVGAGVSANHPSSLTVYGGQLTITGALTAMNTSSSVIISGGSVNGSGAAFNLSGAIVSVSGTGSMSFASVDQSSGTFTLTGGTVAVGAAYILGGGTYVQTAGTFSTGVLNNLEAPSAFNWTGGTVNVTSSGLTIGSGGPLGSSLSLNGGQNLQISSSSYWLTIDGGSLALNGGGLAVAGAEYVGSSATGILSQNTGVHTVGSNLYLGLNNGSSGIYSLSGGDLIVSGALEAGVSGSGVFNQSGGGLVEVANLQIGSNSTASGNYLLSGTAFLSAATYIQVGDYGTGVFNQTGGAAVTQSLYLGYGSGGKGTYILNGTGSLNVSGTTYVGYSGSGVMNVLGGNAISAGGLVLSSSGTYNQSGGTATFAGGTTIASGTTFALTGGTFTTSTITLTNTSTGITWTGGTLNLTDLNETVTLGSGGLIGASNLVSSQNLTVGGKELERFSLW